MRPGLIAILLLAACSSGGGGVTGDGGAVDLARGGDAGPDICVSLGSACKCPGVAPGTDSKCSGNDILANPHLECINEICRSFCNAPTPAERQAKCPSGFQCVDYGNSVFQGYVCNKI